MKLSNTSKKKFIKFLRTLNYHQIIFGFEDFLREINAFYQYNTLDGDYIHFYIGDNQIDYVVYYGDTDGGFEKGVIARKKLPSLNEKRRRVRFYRIDKEGLTFRESVSSKRVKRIKKVLKEKNIKYKIHKRDTYRILFIPYSGLAKATISIIEEIVENSKV